MAELTPKLLAQLPAYPAHVKRETLVPASPGDGVDDDTYRLTMEDLVMGIHWDQALRGKAVTSGSPATPTTGDGTVTVTAPTELSVSSLLDIYDIQPGALLTASGGTVRVLEVNVGSQLLTIDTSVSWSGPQAFTYRNMLFAASEAPGIGRHYLKGYINHNGHYVSVNQSGVALSQYAPGPQTITNTGAQVIGWGDGLQAEDWNPLGEWDSVDQTFRPTFTGVYQVSYILPWQSTDPDVGWNLVSYIIEKPVGLSQAWVKSRQTIVPNSSGTSYGDLKADALVRLDKTKAYQLYTVALGPSAVVVLRGGEPRHLSFRGVADLT